MPARLLNRRTATASLVAFPMVWTGLRAQPVPARRPTPAQTEGPFYPVSLPKDSDFDLLRNGSMSYARGEPAWVEGNVADLQGKPSPGGDLAMR